MKQPRILIIRRKTLFRISVIAVIMIVLGLLAVYDTCFSASEFIAPMKNTIVIDAGHGGIDGGTNQGELLEKDVNLDIALKLAAIMKVKGYQVVMTRESDIALDDQNQFSTSRHKRDLSARVNIINSSKALLFISIHVNCNLQKPAADGALVFYNDHVQGSETLASCIQTSLNGILVHDQKRTAHDPQHGDYYILNHSQISGVLVETAFISNNKEKRLLETDEFRQQLAAAIADGTEKYLYESN